MGYYGYFVKDVHCYEEFPETYHQFRKRHEKWVKGDCEYLHHEFIPFLFSKQVTLTEKLDVLLACFSLFIPAVFLVYLFTANVLLPMLIAETHTVSINLFGHSIELMSGYFTEPYFKTLWTFDFFMITMIGMFAPIFCYFGKLFSQYHRIAGGTDSSTTHCRLPSSLQLQSEKGVATYTCKDAETRS